MILSGTLWILRRPLTARRAQALTGLFLVGTGVDLLRIGARFNPGTRPDEYFPVTPEVRSLQSVSKGGRFATDTALLMGMAYMYGLEDVGMQDPMTPSCYLEALRAGTGYDAPERLFGNVRRLDAPLLDFLNVRARLGGGSVIRHAATPSAVFPDRLLGSRTQGELLERLASVGDLLRNALVLGRDEAFGGSAEILSIEQPAPETIRVRVRTDTARVLVLPQSDDGGWGVVAGGKAAANATGKQCISGDPSSDRLYRNPLPLRAARISSRRGDQRRRGADRVGSRSFSSEIQGWTFVTTNLRVMKRSPAHLCLAIFVVLGTLIGFMTLQKGGPVDLFERGHWLGPASDMLVGKVPFRDTFPVHGFLADGGLDLLLFRLFGPSFRLSLYAHHFLGAFFQAALFLVTAAATRNWIVAALTIPINLCFTTALVADRPIFPLLSLAFFLWALGAIPKRGRAFAAGLLGGVGLLYALDFGTFVLLAELCGVGLVVWSSRGRSSPAMDVNAFLAGVALPVGGFCTYLAWHSALGDFLRISFVDLPRHIDEVWGMPFPSPWDLATAWLHGRQYAYDSVIFGAGLAKRLYLAPALGAIGIATAWIFRRREGARAALRLAVVSVACLLFFRHSIARLHLEVGNALTGPTFVIVLSTIARYAPVRGVRQGRRLRAGLAALAVCGALIMNLPGRLAAIARGASVFRGSAVEGFEPLTVPRGDGILVPRGEAAEIEALVAFCSCALPPGASILDLTNRPGLYFFLNRRNSSRFYQVPLMQPFEEEVVESIDRAPPAMVILAGGSQESFDRRPNWTRVPSVWRLVRERYPLKVSVAANELRFPAPASSVVGRCLR